MKAPNSKAVLGTDAGTDTNALSFDAIELMNGGDLNAVREIAYPNRTNVFQSNQYHSGSARTLVDTAAAARRHSVTVKSGSRCRSISSRNAGIDAASSPRAEAT